MPSYRQRIYLCPEENGQPGWIMDFPIWWDPHALFKTYGGRQIDTGHPLYADYGLLLTAWEALAWDEQCRVNFANDPRIRAPGIAEEMQQLQVKLKSTSWMIVESYEWESGIE